MTGLDAKRISKLSENRYLLWIYLSVVFISIVICMNMIYFAITKTLLVNRFPFWSLAFLPCFCILDFVLGSISLREGTN